MSRMMKSGVFCGLIVALLLVSGALGAEPEALVGPEPADDPNEVAFEEVGNVAPWYMSVGLGWMDFEGDEDFDDGFSLAARLGYDHTERWTVEGALYLAPSLAGGDDVDWSSTYALTVALDGLFHFTRWERLDPYLSAGIGFTHFGEEPSKGDQDAFLLRGGAGVMYHFNDEWAVRADFRGMLADFGGNANANSTFDLGLVWTWGARVQADWIADSGPLDTDNDGLTDKEETEVYGTDPYDPDTDKDMLSDGDEVNKYKTEPLQPDTDYDLLKDGEEVLKYETNPLQADTDNGGVSDGHEVLEDGTDPLNGDDDLFLRTLNIEFDTDAAVIKPPYFRDIDIIGKVLTRSPASTAVIEGHADQRKKSIAVYNQKLSERRARAVMAYLVENCAIDAGRLKAVGYGFSRPKFSNDPVEGNPLNRRVDVYIRGLNAEDRAALAAGDEEGAAVEPAVEPADK